METNTPTTHTRRNRRREWITAGTVVALVAIGGTTAAVVSTATADHATAIEQADQNCGNVASVSDDGHSVSFDTKGEEDTTGDDLLNVVCMMDLLDMPEPVIQRIDHTRALDGVQTGTWDGYEASWSYHPDSGMFLLVEVAK